jgi:ribosome-binding protein aMBF1 (putative translation factor)
MMTKSAKNVKTDGTILYVCENCDYVTSQKHHYKKHLETKKHEKNEMMTKVRKSAKIRDIYVNVENHINIDRGCQFINVIIIITN